MSAIRDPRLNPQPGDILEKISRNRGIRRHLIRCVTHGPIFPPNPNWCYSVRYTDGVTGKKCDLRAWRRWAKSAEVIGRA